MKATDDFFLKHPEPVKAVLLALREIILQQDAAISCVFKYGMPFSCYKRRMFCYLWVQKKSGKPYLGIVEGNSINHPGLIMENRSRMKIMLLDPDEDLPVNSIRSVLKQALDLYRNGVVKIRVSSDGVLATNIAVRRSTP